MTVVDQIGYNGGMSVLATIALVVLVAVAALVLLAAIVAATRRNSRSALVWLIGLAAIAVAWLVVWGVYQLLYDEADLETSGVRLSMRAVGIGVATIIALGTSAKANNYQPDVAAPPAVGQG